MSETQEKKSKSSLNDLMLKSHETVLSVLKQVSYLAVLGSLCIAIATLTGKENPEVQVYALTAATLFLVAFLTSFVARLFSVGVYVVPSYVAMIGGVIMLFLVVQSFYTKIALVNRCFEIVGPSLIFAIVPQFCYWVYQRSKKLKSNYKYILVCINVISGLIIMFFWSIYILEQIFLITIFQKDEFVTILVQQVLPLFMLISGLVIILPTSETVKEYIRMHQELHRSNKYFW
ncbi:MAG: hypothetical protein IAX21_01345 [Candidatus Bathyarchaeota archaeon]|nr:MAG: hypothetical protein IAX21_01345 [Candidatus Bathyarchaeota archaeon]